MHSPLLLFLRARKKVLFRRDQYSSNFIYPPLFVHILIHSPLLFFCGHEKRYWKEHCFGLTAETLVDKAMMLSHLGGTFGGNQQPTKFLCLVLKMLQIQPEKEIIIEFIKNEDYK